MVDKFKTIHEIAEAEIIEKKSKFIASASPIETEDDAQAFIDVIRKKHFNARHHCYAYQLDEIKRYSDGGEPTGTAGLPILHILSGNEIRNSIIVVTRYFGGTLLGTGGLTRAYSSAAKAVLSKAVIIEKKLVKIISVKTDYSQSSKVQHEILNGGNTICETNYTDIVEFVVFVEFGLCDNFIKVMNEATSATAEIEVIKEAYCAIINGKVEIF